MTEKASRRAAAGPAARERRPAASVSGREDRESAATDLPADIASALESGEAVEARFRMAGGLEVFATERRFFGRREDRVRDIRYVEVSEARRRTSDWRSWPGLVRIGLGTLFVAAGVVTGSGTALEAAVALALILVGTGLVLIAIRRQEDWVEIKIERREPPPSFWYIVVFLPFWLLLQSRKRYRVQGDREAVDAFYSFLSSRL